MFSSPDNRGWPAPARPVVRVKLHFGAATDGKLLKNFSAATRIGRSLFVAADERVAIERLSNAGDGWSDHWRLQIGDSLDVDDDEAMADIEGLAWEGEGKRGILVVFDSPAKDRLDRAGRAIETDLFDLPS